MKQKNEYEKELKKLTEELDDYKKHETTRKDIEHILKEKNIYIETIEGKLSEKNDYIAKLEAKIEKMEAKLDAKLEKLESTVTTIALESKTVSTKAAHAATTNNTTLNTNITVNNVLNLSQEHVKKVLTERLNYNVVYAGQAGLATFVFDNILKDSTGKLIYRCVDASRQMFEFVDENGETVRDMKAEKLTQSLLKGDVIRLGLEAAAVGWNTENEKLNTERVGVFGPKVNEYDDLNRNNTVFRSKVSSLTT
jgi:DNA repair exonuclease SbcCD ATPase subunit